LLFRRKQPAPVPLSPADTRDLERDLAALEEPRALRRALAELPPSPAVEEAVPPEVVAARERVRAWLAEAPPPAEPSPIDTMPIKDVLAEARRLGIERKGDLAGSVVKLREAVKAKLAERARVSEDSGHANTVE